MDPDEEVMRRFYYTGHYQKCTNEFYAKFRWHANDLKREIKTSQWFLYCLSQLSLGKGVSLMIRLKQYEGMDDSQAEIIKALLRLCVEEEEVDEVDAASGDDLSLPTCWQTRWIAAVCQKDPQRSLELLHPVKDQPDCRLLRIQVLLQLNRPDKVSSEEQIPSDRVDIVSQLGSAMYYCKTCQFARALSIYTALEGRHSQSCLLLNNRAVCLRALNKKAEALKALERAVELQSNDTDVLWNLMVTTKDGSTSHESFEVSIDDIRSSRRRIHAFVKDYEDKEAEIARLCVEMKNNVALRKSSPALA